MLETLASRYSASPPDNGQGWLAQVHYKLRLESAPELCLWTWSRLRSQRGKTERLHGAFRRQ